MSSTSSSPLTPRISPSILASDFAHLASELERIESADWAHVDVMDNHFVPNLTLGLPVVESLARVSPVPLDCHLMIEDPDRWAADYAEAGAGSVTFHVEAATDPVATARSIRAAGARAAVAIKPDTPFQPYEELLDEVDMVLVMTVEPGFGGQSFMDDQLAKVSAVREAVRRRGSEIWVQVDGGVSAETIGRCAEAGADVFVAGSAVYGADDVPAAIADLRDRARRHLCG
ncbi:ribulose-phosphate 3-epimerase [uncultured Serinicoccus sp.]|uniref:ribulose-phosphate 3-epimerase n=1 Tax=uncultured Serinicoccus sp. TaxID=735514 RepID=UPI002618694E|nr:ribulose-phosphate 3-epimerase [uncultured Serinicoccus sp.]